MSFQLKKVSIKNFGSVREAEIVFPEYGMVLVRGINDCSHGKLDSCGSGKTLAGEAIFRTCFGVAGRFANYGHFSNDHTGNKNTMVEVGGLLHGKEINIRSGFKYQDNPNGEGLAYDAGSGWVQRGHIDNTRLELSRLLGVTPEVASWTLYVDGDKLNFGSLSQTELVDLVLASLNQPPWTEYADKAKTRYTRVKTETDLLEDKLIRVAEDAKEKKEEALNTKNVYVYESKELKHAAQAISQEKVNIDLEIKVVDDEEIELVDKKKVIAKKIKAHEEERAEAYAKFEKKKLELKTKLEDARRKSSRLLERKTDVKSELRRLMARAEEINALPENCPTCGRGWDHSHEKKEIEKVNKALEASKELSRIETEKYTESEKAALELEERMDELDESLAEQQRANTAALSERYALLENKSQANSRKKSILLLKKAELRVDDSKMLRAKYAMESAEKSSEESQQKLVETASKLKESKKDMAISGYLRQAFGPKGIPNMVLQEALTPLNESSRIISARMTGNSISVQYSTSKELVSGETRSELILKCDNRFGAKRLKGNSKGESGLTNLIVAETIAEMSNVASRVAFRWYDEVVRNPDKTMRQNFFSYVADMAKRKKMLCFVVDHGAEAANYADYVLVAHKTAKGTSYFWDS